MKYFLTPSELDADADPFVQSAKAHIRARLLTSDAATSVVLRSLVAELDPLWRRTAAERAWRAFWANFKLHSLGASDVYAIKLFLAESFPDRTTAMDVRATEQCVAVRVAMDGYDLATTVPVLPRVPRKSRASTTDKMEPEKP